MYSITSCALLKMFIVTTVACICYKNVFFFSQYMINDDDDDDSVGSLTMTFRCMCVCASGFVRTTSSIFMDGFQNNLAKLFSVLA